jgi:hypothetical protein
MDNELSSSLPATFGAMSSLDYLAADNNNLSGSLPAELGACVLLTLLCVRPARSSASVRSRTAHVRRRGGAATTDQRTTRRNLASNALVGSIPASYTALTRLQNLCVRVRTRMMRGARERHVRGTLPREGHPRGAGQLT